MDVAGTHVVHDRASPSPGAPGHLRRRGECAGRDRRRGLARGAPRCPWGSSKACANGCARRTSPSWGATGSASPPTSGARAASTAAMILMVVGIGLACTVLAAVGRRLTALVPLVGLLAIDRAPSVMQTWSIPPFLDRPIARVGLDLGARGRSGARGDMGRQASPGAQTRSSARGVRGARRVRGRCGLRRVRLERGVGSPFRRHRRHPVHPVAGPARRLRDGRVRHAARTRRPRWWPWILVATAFLLSAAPSMALLSAQDRFPTYAGFGLVVPLALVGLVGSAWRPVADLIVAKGLIDEPAEGEAPPPARITTPMRDLPRAAILADVLAAGLVVVSLILFAADPLAAEIEATIPTYVGVRVPGARRPHQDGPPRGRRRGLRLPVADRDLPGLRREDRRALRSHARMDGRPARCAPGPAPRPH